MTRKTKNRRRKVFRKELSASWSKGAHRALKQDLVNKREFKQETL
jgi:hypothetical protein